MKKSSENASLLYHDIIDAMVAMVLVADKMLEHEDVKNLTRLKKKLDKPVKDCIKYDKQ